MALPWVSHTNSLFRGRGGRLGLGASTGLGGTTGGLDAASGAFWAPSAGFGATSGGLGAGVAGMAWVGGLSG